MAILTFFGRVHFVVLVLEMFPKMADMIELDIRAALIWKIRKHGVSVGKTLELLLMARTAALIRHGSQIEIGAMMFAVTSSAYQGTPSLHRSL
ncbi:uncharacterized protein METZ01_LOCUS339481, partial [marine metagenome]